MGKGAFQNILTSGAIELQVPQHLHERLARCEALRQHHALARVRVCVRHAQGALPAMDFAAEGLTDSKVCYAVQGTRRTCHASEHWMCPMERVISIDCRTLRQE